MSPNKLKTEIATQAAKVTDLLNAGLVRDAALSKGDTAFWSTRHESFKVFVTRTTSVLLIGVAFEQRPGVWHDVGNFYDDPAVVAFREQCGITTFSEASARLDKFAPSTDVVGTTVGLIRLVA